jgi:hypothetical protein
MISKKAAWHFRTIGLGTLNYRAASKRLAKEARALGIFDTSVGHTEKFLKEISPLFWSRHENILKARVPGFGWYIWKPEYIKKCLENIPLGDGLIYCDAGNWLSQNEKDLQTFSSYMDLALMNGVVGSNNQDFVEEKYSTLNLMNLLNLSSADRKSNQFMAGFILLVNSPEGRSFVNSWSEIACKDNHEYLLPDLKKDVVEGFDTHAKDQAIFSCLMKSLAKPSVQIGDKVTHGCVRAVRHRYGYRFMNPSVHSMVLYGLISKFSRVKLYIERRIYNDSLTLRPNEH